MTPNRYLGLLIPPGIMDTEIRPGHVFGVRRELAESHHLTGRVTSVGPADGRPRAPAGDGRVWVTLHVRELCPGERVDVELTVADPSDGYPFRRLTRRFLDPDH